MDDLEKSARETDQQDLDDVIELAIELRDGEISEADKNRLESLLRHDEAVRRQYIRFMRDSAYLSIMTSGKPSLAETSSTLDAEGDGEPAKSPVLGFLAELTKPSGEFFSRPTPISLTIAMLVVIGAVVSLSFVYVGGDQERRAENPPPVINATPVLVAHITGSDKSEWAPGAIIRRRGDRLYASDIVELSAGVLRIEFENHTIVLLQGPVRFRVDSQQAGRLLSGRLTARVPDKVPDKATSFLVETSAARVVDLGTEFGVHVDQNQTALVHVFVGRVEVGAKDQSGVVSDRKRVLTTGEAMRIDKRGRMEEDAGIQKFLRQLPSQSTEPLRTLAHFRMGEDNRDARVGQPVSESLRESAGRISLRRFGEPRYTSAKRSGGGSLAVEFDDQSGDHFKSKDVLTKATDNWVLESWVKANETEKAARVVFNGSSSTSGYGLAIIDGQWMCLFGGVRLLGFGAPCEPGRWTHVAVVREQGLTRLFVDGKQAGQASNETPRTPQGIFMIGGSPASVHRSFDGQIDDVRFSLLTGPFDPQDLLFHAH